MEMVLGLHAENRAREASQWQESTTELVKFYEKQTLPL